VRNLLRQLHAWADDAQVEPIKAWAGYNVGSGDHLASPQSIREQIEDGVIAIWMPTARSARTISKIGGPPIWWDKTANPRDHTGPLPWDEAVTRGQIGGHDRVVVLVTGTGLKTPTAVDVGRSAEIAPDVDELLEQLGVAV